MSDDVRSYAPREVAAKFNVHVRTVARWGSRGSLPSFRTPGGERRYVADAIDKMIAEGEHPSA